MDSFSRDPELLPEMEILFRNPDKNTVQGRRVIKGYSQRHDNKNSLELRDLSKSLSVCTIPTDLSKRTKTVSIKDNF